MPTLPIQFKYSLAPLLLVLSCILLAVFEPRASEKLAYDTALINDWQWWRLFSGHFLHTNTPHLLLNLSGVVLLWALHGHYYLTKQYLLTFIVLCFATSLSLFFFSPELKLYVGLSGVLHGLFVIGAYFDIVHRFKTGWILLLGISAKVIYEQLYGASPDVAAIIDANVAIDAHLFGALSGATIVLCLQLKKMASNPYPRPPKEE